jgi:hypothetical protein
MISGFCWGPARLFWGLCAGAREGAPKPRGISCPETPRRSRLRHALSRSARQRPGANELVGRAVELMLYASGCLEEIFSEMSTLYSAPSISKIP